MMVQKMKLVVFCEGLNGMVRHCVVCEWMVGCLFERV